MHSCRSLSGDCPQHKSLQNLGDEQRRRSALSVHVGGGVGGQENVGRLVHVRRLGGSVAERGGGGAVGAIQSIPGEGAAGEHHTK